MNNLPKNVKVDKWAFLSIALNPAASRRERIIGRGAWVLGILVGVGIVVAVQGWFGERTMTAAEMKVAIEKCWAENGVPTPIYDEADHVRVFRVECPEQTYNQKREK